MVFVIWLHVSNICIYVFIKRQNDSQLQQKNNITLCINIMQQMIDYEQMTQS